MQTIATYPATWALPKKSPDSTTAHVVAAAGILWLIDLAHTSWCGHHPISLLFAFALGHRGDSDDHPPQIFNSTIFANFFSFNFVLIFLFVRVPFSSLCVLLCCFLLLLCVYGGDGSETKSDKSRWFSFLHDYLEEEAILSRKCYTCEKIDDRQLLHAESPVPAWGVWVIRPGPWGWYQKLILVLSFFFSLPSPLYRTTSNLLRGCPRAGRFRATLLLRTTLMRL